MKLDDHKRIGERVLNTRNDLQLMLNALSKEIGVSSPLTKRLIRILKNISELRSDLDNIVAEEYPNVDTKSIYYGGESVKSNE